MSCLCVPQQDQIIDIEDQRSGAGGRLSDAVLRIFKAPKLFDITEANLQEPASGEDLQDMRGGEGEIEGEEAIVAAATLGSCTATIRRSCWPALGYHRASMVWYQSLTRFP